MTEQELNGLKEEISNAVFERVLLALPDVIGNLIANHAALLKLNKEFYDKHPEFKGKQHVVQSVVEKVESDNLGLKYEDILEKAVPFIRERIALMETMDVSRNVKNFPTDFKQFNHSNQNGKL